MSDVVELILADHTELRTVLEKMKTGDVGARALLMPLAASMLISHSRAEESQVYPVVANEANDADDVEHSQEEHAGAEILLEQLYELDPASAQFPSALQDLVDAVHHHMEEEETKVLPAMRSGLSDARREELGAAFLTARLQHWGDEPGAATKADLVTQATNAGIENASSMSKAQLKKALEKSAEM
jgi:hemerythrin-like domain-containing protein